MKSIVGMLRDTNPSTRKTGAKLLITKGREVVLPYLLESARDPHSKARAWRANRWSGNSGSASRHSGAGRCRRR